MYRATMRSVALQEMRRQGAVEPQRPGLRQERRPGRSEVLGDGADAPGVLPSLGRKLCGVDRGPQAVACCLEAGADGLRLVRGRRIVLGLETDQTDDFSDQTQAFLAEQDSGGTAHRIVDDHFEDECQVHQRAEGSWPARTGAHRPEVDQGRMRGMGLEHGGAPVAPVVERVPDLLRSVEPGVALQDPDG
jgi:hypothetical protein